MKKNRRNAFLTAILGLAPVIVSSITAPEADGDQASATTKAQVRQLSFPDKSVGGVYLCPFDIEQTDINGWRQSKRVCPAMGKVKVTLPPGQTIMFEVNPYALKHPEVLKNVGEVGIDRMRVAYINMENSLDENSPSVTDKVFEQLPHFKHLISIEAFQSDLTDKGVEYLASLKSLRLLSAMMTGVKGHTLGALANLPDLVILNLKFCSLDRGVLVNLKNCRSLRHLHLHGAAVTDGDLAGLEKIKSLRLLDISQNKRLTDGAVDYLIKMQQLETLNISETDLSMIAMKKLSKLQPKVLYLPRVHYSDTEMDLLNKYFPHTNLVKSARQLKSDDKKLFAPIPGT